MITINVTEYHLRKIYIFKMKMNSICDELIWSLCRRRLMNLARPILINVNSIPVIERPFYEFGPDGWHLFGMSMRNNLINNYVFINILKSVHNYVCIILLKF